jgi:hypothetical protein
MKGMKIMNEALVKVRKRLKWDTVGFLVVIILLIALAGSSIAQAIIQGTKERSSFEVRLEFDSNVDSSFYVLYVDGELHSIVDYNDFARPGSSGDSMNPKGALVIEYTVRAFQCLLGAAVFFMMYLVFVQVQKEHSPFTRKNVLYLRIAAVITMFLGLLPGAVKLFMSIVVYNSTYVPFTVGALLTVVIGGVFWTIAEIFMYGCAVQEDLDQIA